MHKHTHLGTPQGCTPTTLTSDRQADSVSRLTRRPAPALATRTRERQGPAGDAPPCLRPSGLHCHPPRGSGGGPRDRSPTRLKKKKKKLSPPHTRDEDTPRPLARKQQDTFSPTRLPRGETKDSRPDTTAEAEPRAVDDRGAHPPAWTHAPAPRALHPGRPLTHPLSPRPRPPPPSPSRPCWDERRRRRTDTRCPPEYRQTRGLATRRGSSWSEVGDFVGVREGEEEMSRGVLKEDI